MLQKNITTIPAIILNNPNIKGVVISADMCEVEASQGTYNFGRMDSLLAQCRSDWKVTIGIAMAGQRQSQGDSVPDWAYDLVPMSEMITYIDHNVNHSTNGQPVSIAVPSSQTWLTIKQGLIAVAGAHFSNNPQVASVVACVFTGSNVDFSVPSGTTVDGIAPAGSTITSRMLAALPPGVTFHVAMVNAGATMLNAYASAFGNAVVMLPTGPINASEDSQPMGVVSDTISAARSRWGTSRIIVVNYGGSNKMPNYSQNPTGDLGYLGQNPPSGFQALWNVSGDNTYRMNGGIAADAVTIFEGFITKVASYGSRYTEIYQKDAVDPTMAPAIAFGDTQLNPSMGARILRSVKKFFELSQ